LQRAQAIVDRALAEPISVPIPRDAAGGTHERHKLNYVQMQAAGFLYQVKGDIRYAHFVRDMLLQYAALYPTLGLHPKAKSQAPGKLFHQMLNETVWLVNTSQAYDCVYDTLTPADRTRIEDNVLRPMARFFTVDEAHEFDRIHNHGTWADTAVGLTGYVLGDPQLVKMALDGTRLDGSSGYLRQLDELFSPDGYYVEGPYYARYALEPFFLFAEAIANNQPELAIFARRDHLLNRAVFALLQQTSPSGAFIPFNDALKEKDIRSDDAVLAVDEAYAHDGHDPRLLSIARRQGKVTLGIAGLEVARALATTPNPPPFPFRSVEYRDGPDGNRGGIAILRGGPARDPSVALLKYTSFGMEHGHYDKLGFIYYDQDREIIPDYGSARFLNVDQKDGGRYLIENTTFAKQTIAHNTVTVDERSDYGGSYKAAENQHSEREFFDAHDPDFQVTSAVDRTAYPGVLMQRTLAMVRDPHLLYPVVLDVFRLTSAQPHRYDLPYYYEGTFLDTNVPLTHHPTERPILGRAEGYQHLWVAAEGKPAAPVSFTWMNGDRYYSLISATSPSLQVKFVQVGAHDPNFDLRNENAILLRSEGAGAHVFASVIEPHGDWNGVSEQTFGNHPTITAVEVLAATDEGTAVRITGKDGLAWTLLVASPATAKAASHHLATAAGTYSWSGFATLQQR
ncbi:MAG TPA: heparinase II/III family protein, partial [Opitutaceae bacterium]|nr:heparinase II/III family protein [Opitutaceae bacterium]